MTAHANPMAARANGSRPQPASTRLAHNLRGIFGALERLGYDIDALIAPFGMRRSELDAKDACIAGEVCEAVLAKALQERRVRNLPLRVAMEMPIGANPLLDYIVASADTVGDGIERLSRFRHLVSPATSFDLRVEEDPIRVIIATPADAFRVELTTALSILRLFRETSEQLRVVQVCFRHEPEDVAEFARILRCPVQPNASWNGWTLTPEAWRLPLVHADPILRSWLEQRATKILDRNCKQRGPMSEVRRVLATRMAGGDMSIQAVARTLATTPRTLQRRLSEQGTTFETVREATRKEAAEALLADSTISLSEVAFLLGYSESAAFHRAFKRWHNTTPQDFRIRRERRASHARSA